MNRDPGDSTGDSSGLIGQRIRDWFATRVPVFWDNWLAAAGSVLVVVSIFLLTLLFGVFLYNILLGREMNPYVSLVGYLLLPAFLLLGVVLLIAGNLVRRSREKREGRRHVLADIGGGNFVRKAVVVLGVTAVVLIGVGLFSFEAYHYTDSNQFCSYTCHEVMEPEATVYARSPHAHVDCVRCHIGPGASWFVRSKLSGLRQVYAVLTHTYDRPIPTPVENLRPARETCEVCHWPARVHGSKLVAHERFASDADNTKLTTALVVHVGGPEGPGPSATASGIHWHVDPSNQVRYRHLDSERHDIVEVVQSTAEGEIRYLRDGADPDTTLGTWRIMDCLDCHNRPTHIYELPNRALDLAFATGALDVSVPWLRREGERVLREVVPDEQGAEGTAARIAEALRAIYREEHPESLAALEKALTPAAAGLTRILERNVWPRMNITWGTYRSNLSHFDTEGEISDGGCFRCHDDEHVADSGATISQDCETCHAMLAWEEKGWEGVHGLDATVFLQR